MAARGNLAAMSFRVSNSFRVYTSFRGLAALALAALLAAPAAAQITGPTKPRRWEAPRAPDADVEAADPDTPRGSMRRAPKAEAKPAPRKPAATRAEQLDQLYARLAKAKDGAEAQGVSLRIERLLARSPSDTANLLMGRALTAAAHDEKLVAEDLIDRILELEPNWAEAWTRRAALRAGRDDVSGAVGDFAQALKIEPRHIGALSGLGFLMLRIERRDEALRALNKALELNPFLEPAKKVAAKLAAERGGQAL